MTQQELIDRLAERTHISKRAAKLSVEIVFQSMTDALADGGKVEIRGFGRFSVRRYDGYTGRNPKTGELVEVKSKKMPFFKVGKDLMERINSAG